MLVEKELMGEIVEHRAYSRFCQGASSHDLHGTWNSTFLPLALTPISRTQTGRLSVSVLSAPVHELTLILFLWQQESSKSETTTLLSLLFQFARRPRSSFINLEKHFLTIKVM